MPNPYATIFRAPGAKGFATAAFFARLPFAMVPIGIVAMLSQTHDGGYLLAGAVSATFALSFALISPQVSRLTDRFGQSAVLTPTTIVSVLAFAVLLLATNQKWPTWTLFASSIVAAVMPSMPAMVRARWSELFSGRPELNTAFAFESAADELMYISGASLAVVLSVTFFPEAGILVSTVLLALGSAAFIAQRSTEPPIKPAEKAGSGSAIRLRPVQIVTLALIFVGAIFATAEVTTVAITKAWGEAGSAGLVIGVYAVGSFVIGLIVGALNIKTPLHRQIAVAIAVLALTQIPLLWAGTVPWLALAVFVSGVAISPTFITAFGLIEQRVPAAMLTEGITWVTTGIGIGMALGSFLAGWVVDAYGAQNGFWVSVGMGAAALVTVLIGQRALAGGVGNGAGYEAIAEPAE